ncbi:hypothetical protein MKX57_15295 [Lysinibacillus sp. FSL M8-0216]|jgi:hypothetical protein|uniref:hypothetical protein n=1 Tax=Lysinibacillus TaxID=400634 RepID=UPI000D33F058|nr:MULTISPECIES: hypothetical protein [Lysinibacillus]MED4670329.1 hypothetical protein [Lysinibacillus fusiformis]QAS56584.1 hypothetical protein LSP_09475 [Lysinibacillus sphaericus]RDV30369.1 hypothetical protein C7B90_15280 [Lysinibacillus fusiformis]GED66263.1 hypothetical protein LFU01_47150 [Lysinibacillus fusiformis]
MNIKSFEKISLNGRVSFGISCLESTLQYLDYNVDEWRIVLEYLWDFTSVKYIDDWSGIISEIIPENLLEFKFYEEHDFEYLDEKNFEYLYNLYQNIDEKIDFVITSIYNIGTSHAYTKIVEYGQDSLDELEILINYLIENEVPLPDITPFKSLSIDENKGWGNSFVGSRLSKIL